jgi:hypothetical protein
MDGKRRITVKRFFQAACFMVFIAVLIHPADAILTAGQETPQEVTGRVTSIMGGNTITVFDGTRNSLYVLDGVRPPAPGEKNYREAILYLQTMILNKDVRITVTGQSKYVTYAKVYTPEGTLLNEDIKEKGFVKRRRSAKAAPKAVVKQTPTANQKPGEKPEVLDKNEFVNSALGFRMRKPDGWTYLSAATVEEQMGQQRLQDRELEQIIRRYATAPLVVMTKYPEPYDDLNATVAVKVESVGTQIDVSPVTLLEMTIGVMERAYRDFTVTEGVIGTTVDGLEAAYMKADHFVMDAKGREYASRSRIWLVPRGQFMFLIAMTGPQDGPDVSEDEFSTVLASVDIEQ